MKKRIIFALLTVLTVQLIVCSCKFYADDPFVSENTAEKTTNAAEQTTGGDDTTAAAGALVCPDGDFYSLSADEAFEKYGVFSIANYPNYEDCCDGKYSYMFYSVGTDEKYWSTLGRIKYPNGEDISPVCADPLCTHSPTSACPFAVCGGYAAKVVCYGGSLFFFTNVGSGLYKYEQKTNKSVLLISGAYDGCFYKYDGSLYFVYGEEQKDEDGNGTFELFRVFAKISPDGKVTELGRLSDNITTWITVYKDRYAIDFKPELYEENGVITVLSRDLKTGDSKTVTKIECEGAKRIDYIEACTIYGGKLLVRLQYYIKDGIASEYDKRNHYCLIDLEKGDYSVVCSPCIYYYGTSLVQCLYSSKLITWFEPKPKKNDPMIVHIYSPFDDKDETYNLSEIIKKETGDDLPQDAYLSGMTNSAVLIRRKWRNGNDKQTKLYEVDVLSGKVYKYEYPVSQEGEN